MSEYESLKLQLNQIKDEVEMLLNTNYSSDGIKLQLAKAVNDIAVLKQQVNSLSGVEGNVNNVQITQLINDVNTLSETLDEHIIDYNSLSLSLTATKSVVYGHTQEIATLQEQVEDLENNSGADTSELESTIDELSAKFNTFVSLIKDRNAVLNTPFEGFDEETVYQTYDSNTRRYNFCGSELYTAAATIFRVESLSTTAQITLNLGIKGVNSGGSARLCFYLNNGELNEMIEFDFTDSQDVYEFTFNKQVNTGNFFVYTIRSLDNVPLEFYYEKVDISNCVNPIILNKLPKFNVDYYDGYYYLVDCSGKTAKIAKIGKDDIATINDVVWQDTGIEAQYGFTTAKLNKTTTPAKAEYPTRVYVLQDTTMYFECEDLEYQKTFRDFKISNITYTYPANPLAVTYNVNYNSSTGNIRTSTLNYNENNTGSVSNYSYPETISNMLELRCSYDNLTSGSSNTQDIRQRRDGTYYFNYSTATLDLGVGQCYAGYFQGNFSKCNIYVKVYNQIVKHNLSLNSASRRITLNSSEIVGNYDYYYEGANDDYFVIKNNKLYYYKNELQDLDL